MGIFSHSLYNGFRLELSPWKHSIRRKKLTQTPLALRSNQAVYEWSGVTNMNGSPMSKWFLTMVTVCHICGNAICDDNWAWSIAIH